MHRAAASLERIATLSSWLVGVDADVADHRAAPPATTERDWPAPHRCSLVLRQADGDNAGQPGTGLAWTACAESYRAHVLSAVKRGHLSWNIAWDSPQGVTIQQSACKDSGKPVPPQRPSRARICSVFSFPAIIPTEADMPDVEYTIEGAIGLLRFNRPERMNAITYEMLTDIERIAREANADERVRALIVTGAGRAFSAGIDLQQLSARPPSAGRAESLGAAYGEGAPAPWTFPSIRKPVIAAINGAAVGLGAEFTLQCDLRLAGESARIGWVFVHRGLVPDTAAGTWLLARIVGLQEAARLLFSGEIITADRAKQIGYVLDVVPDNQLMARAMELAASVSQGSPLSAAEIKRLLYRGLTRDPMDHLADSTATITRMFASEDFKEGVRAFLEKRPPNWTGR
jgi:enoyl-CoA hydratase/carnithine racemase